MSDTDHSSEPATPTPPPTMPPTNHLSQLAPELLLEITQHLPTTNDRASLARVCRHISTETTGTLYEHWAYNGNMHEPWRFVAFVRTILEKPDLAALIKSIDFHDRIVRSDSPENPWNFKLYTNRLKGYQIHRQYTNHRRGKKEKALLGNRDKNSFAEAGPSFPQRLSAREKKERFENRTREVSEIFQNALTEIGFSEKITRRWVEEFAPWRFMNRKKPIFYSDLDFAVMVPLLCILLLRLPNLREVFLLPCQPAEMPDLFVSALKFVGDRLNATYPGPVAQSDVPAGLQPLDLGPREGDLPILANLHSLHIHFDPLQDFSLHDVLRIFWPFMKLPNLKRLYAHGNDEMFRRNNGAPGFNASEHYGTSGVTEIALDSAELTVQQVQVLLLTCKKLERFRWTRGQKRRRANPTVYHDLSPNFKPDTGLQQAIEPHVNTLQELDLRIYVAYCSGQNDTFGFHVPSLAQFTNLKTLTITPVVFYITHDRKWQVDLGSVLPKSLRYLGLVYAYGGGKNFSCECWRSNDEWAWNGCVPNLAKTISDSLPLCKTVEIIGSRGENPISDDEQKKTDTLLQKAYDAFKKSGVSTSISHIQENDPLPPF